MSNQLFKPPVPGWLDRVNFITAFWWQGCDLPWTLFVQFAGPPAGRAVALLIDLDMGDIVKEFFRPAGLRSHRHGRKGGRKKSKIPELPDLNEEIGKRAPGRKEFAGRQFGSPTFWAFHITDNLDRVAFNVAIIDVVTETLYTGLLGVLSVDNSNCPGMARIGRDRVPSSLLTQPEWSGISMHNLQYLHGGLTDGVFGTEVAAKGMYLATMELSGHNYWSTPESMMIKLFDAWDGRTIAESGRIEIEPDAGWELTISGTIRDPTHIQWQYKGGNSAAGPVHGSVTVVKLD